MFAHGARWSERPTTVAELIAIEPSADSALKIAGNHAPTAIFSIIDEEAHTHFSWYGDDGFMVVTKRYPPF